MNMQIIQVFYPADGAKIFLRTEADWDRNVESTRSDEAGAQFLIETDRPFFYFKPVLRRNGQLEWSRGENFLAVATSATPLDIYPYFSDEMHCSVCELMSPLPTDTGNEHRFRVFLPPGYRENTLKKYPVLYMHDGNNLFLKEEAFLGNTWMTGDVLNVLDRMNAIEEVIVVGVHPGDRMCEYTLPGDEDYGRFLVEVLKLAIDEEYRTLTDVRNSYEMGS